MLEGHLLLHIIFHSQVRQRQNHFEELCSDLILIFLKFACDQIIERMKYFQLCYFQIIQIFPYFTPIMFGQNHETFSSVCSIVVTF